MSTDDTGVTDDRYNTDYSGNIDDTDDIDYIDYIDDTDDTNDRVETC